jgi:hypothetical protein
MKRADGWRIEHWYGFVGLPYLSCFRFEKVVAIDQVIGEYKALANRNLQGQRSPSSALNNESHGIVSAYYVTYRVMTKIYRSVKTDIDGGRAKMTGDDSYLVGRTALHSGAPKLLSILQLTRNFVQSTRVFVVRTACHRAPPSRSWNEGFLKENSFMERRHSPHKNNETIQPIQRGGIVE